MLGLAHCRCERDGRVSLKRLLDQLQVDVMAVADNEVLGASSDVDRPILIRIGKVSAVEVSSKECGVVVLGIAVTVGHHPAPLLERLARRGTFASAARNRSGIRAPAQRRSGLFAAKTDGAAERLGAELYNRVYACSEIRGIEDRWAEVEQHHIRAPDAVIQERADHALSRSVSKRGSVGQTLCPAPGFRMKRCARDDAVDDAPALERGRIVKVSGEADLAGPSGTAAFREQIGAAEESGCANVLLHLGELGFRQT